jgi:uncharacterized membrane protein (DUF4010 family)
MEPGTMSMSSEISTPATPPASSRVSPLRFPARWVVGSAKAERIFARLLWLLVPLQYYVVTNIVHGLSGDDLIPAVALSLTSIVAIFILSCAAAWFTSPPLEGEQSDSLTGRVRMWVVALMIGTAGGYLLLAISLIIIRVAAHYDVIIYIDLVTDVLMRLLHAFGLDYQTLGALAVLLQAVSNFVYAVTILLVITLVHRARHRGPADPAAPREPGVIWAGLIVATLVTVANCIATMD